MASHSADNERSTTPIVIAHVLPWKAIGGTELGTLRLARSALERGFASLMICRTDAPLVKAFFESHGFEVVGFDAAALDRNWFSHLRQSIRLLRQVRRRGVRVVHCADIYAGDFFALAAKVAGMRVVCHVRNRYEWLTRGQRLWLWFVDRFVFVSKDTADRFGHLASQVRKIEGRTRVVLYDGLTEGESTPTRDPLATRRALGVPADATVVGMVARISVQKDHLTLVMAANEVCRRHAHARFVLIGDDGSEGGAEPEHARQVKNAIAESDHRDRFLCTGFRSDVPDLIAMLDVFVLCTHREGLPLVILEAMAQGKPVVATDVDGIPEIVRDGVTGLLHAHEDANELAAKLDELLDDPERARTMGRAGQDFVAASFGERAFSTNVASLYEGLLGGVEASRRERILGNRELQ